jgi:hypothetical protein
MSPIVSHDHQYMHLDPNQSTGSFGTVHMDRCISSPVSETIRLHVTVSPSLTSDPSYSFTSILFQLSNILSSLVQAQNHPTAPPQHGRSTKAKAVPAFLPTSVSIATATGIRIPQHCNAAALLPIPQSRTTSSLITLGPRTHGEAKSLLDSLRIMKRASDLHT